MVSLLGAKRKLSGYYQKCVDGMINGRISMQTRMTVQTRLDEDMLEDYMKECGAATKEEIDWSNPVIAVAHLLHDPLYRHYIMHGNAKQKQVVYDEMTEEMLDIYWNYEDEHGSRFCDLESKSKRKADKKAWKKRRKEEPDDETDDEVV